MTFNAVDSPEISRSRGFTLMELIVVLAIVGILAALLAPRITSLPSRTTPPVVHFLEQERALAMQAAKPTVIVYQDGSLISQATQARLELGEDDELQILRPQPGEYFPIAELTTFYPDGSMAATEFRHVTPDVTYGISISPFKEKIVYQTE